ncbi:Structural maintenance of chromosomes protein 6 [Exophiala dermatitidis]|uniref:Myosin ATPase n=2 Tax=Exophiala dermatitidis TaxID=5970 RepID=H6C476_EXODN|nr:myosin ATPase [Exophiala dermatitidis NIH/UT8656]KAJ4509100.1 Structural maintenance of chromosomes protein 6 [Exophiala dermatitidis]EHY58412.1 myosin ATPase [Exophiala dermatitidis NIH/UT8656]KAJ4511180.1 Structural maintenance of chromosomes protein 6 [Exophiala dermatitidis]KAJ4511885.1 Structural maintenance of chromosomes protein 6 [Exophiala dermatitidis]KAJ4534743.1 Structural maintenance of chromosomes protein 6 [Exophiala dermatitidis]
MAPLKRSAPFDDGDSNDDSDNNVERSSRVATPASRSSNKRRRTSDESSVRRDASSDNEERANASTPPSELDSDDDGEDEEAMLAATQAVEARKHSNRTNNNEPAAHGILEEVELENFMCHKGMVFKLGPLINFICGKNGSGKSAILTAIVLCLGGKASATNRGAKLQNFIKEGEDHARILCKIKNQGDHAYMPELYGNTIQVERHFSRSGASGFKLKSEKGRIISTRKSDLEEICDHMMLQIENPMTVLSQDQARQFIGSSSQTEKYKFFMKGVQLEQLDQDYRLIEEQQENIRAKIEDKIPDLEDLKKKYERAKNKQELSQKYDSMLDKARDLRRIMAWAQVAEQENIRESYAELVREEDAKIAQAEARLEELDQIFQESDRAATEAKEAYDAARGVVEQMQEEKNEAKARQEEVKRETSEAVAEQRSIRAALKEADRTIQAKKEAIREEEQRLAELHGGGAAQRISDLESARNALEEARRSHAEHKSQREGLLKDTVTMANAVQEAEQAKNAQQQRVRQQEQNLRQLMEHRNSQDLSFHQNMPNLLKALQHERGFQEQPIGPLGKHVRLLKPEWSSILEKSFGSGLNSFIVFGKSDEILLSNIMRRTKCVLPIFIANRQPLNIREPDPRFDTVLRVLEIDNEAVKKQLVIANAIEQTILIPDMSEASDALYSSGQPLENVKRCYCFSPTSRLRGAALSYRNGQAAQDPIHEFHGTPRMRTDIDESIRRQKEAVQESKDQLRNAEEEWRSARNRHQQSNQALVRHDRMDRELKIVVQKAEDAVERLQDAVMEDEVESGKLEVLHQQLTEAEEQKTVHESSYVDSVTGLDKLKARLREATEKLNELDERIRDAEAAAAQAQSVAQKAGKKRAFDLGEKNNLIAQIEDSKRDRAESQANVAKMDEKIANFSEQARAVCERVNVPEGETHESLQKKYKRIQADYHKYHDRIGDREQIATEAAKWSKAYENAKKEVKSLENLRDKLTETMVQRRYRWKQFRNFISHRSKASFMYMLSERGFRGTLTLDHKQKLMDIRVEPDITRRDGTGRSVRTLSGGEKSFSQICLLLAIWEAMGAPIRCLDEFDVFMDAVNRTTSVNLLIEGARQSIGGQFILISPGTKSDIKRAPDVHPIEVPEPERGQTRLAFAPA